MKGLRRFARDDRGNVIVTTAIFLPVLISAMGAAVSYSQGSAVRTKMQQALDSAVLAGASSSDAEAVATARKYFDSNVNSVFVGASAKNIAADFTLAKDTVTGQGSGSVANPFGGIIGPRTYVVSTNSAAIRERIQLCVLGLNNLDNGAFDISGNSKFSAPCAVQANSRNSSGMTMEGQPKAVAKKFGVTGGHRGNGYSPPPIDGSPSIADPYASIPFPAYDTCGKGKKGLDVKNDTVLSPGTYCGGIHVFGNGTKLTLNPGIYVMVGGPFWIDGSSTVIGDRVMIAFTGDGAALQIWGDSTVKLTSPVSGPYMNMQFMQDRDDPNTRGLWNSIGGNTKFQYDGVAYFPTQNFWVFGDAVTTANSPSLTVVADKIWVQGNATFNVTNTNTRNLPIQSPTTTLGARLIK